ncbi:MAG: hypothetical protein IT237_13440 [Bacteroidia bacterium]|nr:hypothetical protein [Bacteroidia bacterium]
MRNKTFKELIENNRIYQNFTDKLDIPQAYYSLPVKTVCQKMDLNSDLIFALLSSYDDASDFPMVELTCFSIAEILNYLKLTHSFYLKKKLPEIEQSIKHLSNSQYELYKQLQVLCIIFSNYRKKLEEHIYYEENTLIPYIEGLLNVTIENTFRSDIYDALKVFSTEAFIHNHHEMETELQKLRKAILNYSNPGKPPMALSILMLQINHFDIELGKHAIIEDYVLIPKVVELEDSLFNKISGKSILNSKNKKCVNIKH